MDADGDDWLLGRLAEVRRFAGGEGGAVEGWEAGADGARSGIGVLSASLKGCPMVCKESTRPRGPGDSFKRTMPDGRRLEVDIRQRGGGWRGSRAEECTSWVRFYRRRGPAYFLSVASVRWRGNESTNAERRVSSVKCRVVSVRYQVTLSGGLCRPVRRPGCPIDSSSAFRQWILCIRRVH